MIIISTLTVTIYVHSCMIRLNQVDCHENSVGELQFTICLLNIQHWVNITVVLLHGLVPSCCHLLDVVSNTYYLFSYTFKCVFLSLSVCNIYIKLLGQLRHEQ